MISAPVLGSELGLAMAGFGAMGLLLQRTRSQGRRLLAVNAGLRASEERYRQLAENHARLAEILEATPDLVAMVSVDGKFTYVNAAVRRLWELADDGLDSLQGLEAYAPASRERVLAEAIPTASREGVWQGELELALPGGQLLPVSHVLVAHRQPDGSVDYFSSISRDVSERRAFEAQLVYQGLHDALTGLPNRALFTDRLSQALARAGRYAGSPCVLLLDLDHFKLVNESYGHELGDQLLLRAMQRISATLRPGDTAARFGGDEFAVLCEGVVDETQAIELADRLSAALAAPFDLAGDGHETRVFLTTSIGIALATPDHDSADAVLRDADAAMYRAKERGRARSELFVEDYRNRSVHRLRTANDLHRALADQEFRVVYQPEVRLADGHVVAVEALVRWHHPERGLVPPVEFIPLAEETGQILGIGTWVLDQAAAQAKAWQQARYDGGPIVVWVNLSARQLSQTDLVTTVAEVLRRHEIDPGSVGLEITESALLEDAEGAIAALAALRGLGVRLAVDDFGTGYSSLSYLKRLPVDQVKVDRSFVDGLGSDADDSAIVAAVTGMARALRLTTVAEGAETLVQVDALRELNCDLVQGYYFTTPQPAANISRLLEADRIAALFPPTDNVVHARPALRIARPGDPGSPLPRPRAGQHVVPPL